MTLSRIDEHLDLLSREESQANEEYAKTLMLDFGRRLEASQSGWLLDLGPTAIDAQLIAFIARMLDRKREDLIPENLRLYALASMKSDEWSSVMGDRNTLPLKL